MATDHRQQIHFRRMIKSLNIALLVLVVFFQIMPKRLERRPQIIPLPKIHVDFIVQNPATVQRVRHGRPRPKRPVIPIPAEELDIPQDLTIDDTEVDWDLGDSRMGNSGLTTTGADTIQARPYFQALPDYPKELRKQKVKGDVKLYLWVDKTGTVKQVTVAENTTNSPEFENAAVQAAWKNKYLPAQVDDEKIPTWVTCIYTFTPE